MQVDQTPEVVCVAALWSKLLSKKDEEARGEMAATIDEISLPAWMQSHVDRIMGVGTVARMDDDLLLAQLGLSREQIEREVANRGK